MEFAIGRESRIGSYGIEWIRHSTGFGGGVSWTRFLLCDPACRSSLLRKNSPRRYFVCARSFREDTSGKET